MGSYSQIYGSFAQTQQTGRSAVSEAAANLNGTTSEFAEQIGAMLGAEFEPDPLFFVESWTIGIPAAMENFQQRRQIQSQPETWQPAFRAFENAAYLNFVEDSDSDEEFFTAARSSFVADTYGASRSTSFREKENTISAEHVSQSTSNRHDPDLIFPKSVESACELLGVDLTSTREQIRYAYRQLASQNHPDRLGQKNKSEQKRGNERMTSINEAYRIVRTNLWGEAA